MDPSGDYAAHFEEMFTAAYRAAYAVLGDRGDAEDVAQDTLAKALVRWRRVSHHPLPWAARVATNGAIDRWRKRERSLTTDRADSQRGQPSADVTQPLATSRQRDDLVRVLRALPRRQREAVVMRHLLDYSEADTATALKCSIGSVKSATSRGLGRLRELLEDPSVLESTIDQRSDTATN